MNRDTTTTMDKFIRPKDRDELQLLLEAVLGVQTDERVQFQPPEGAKFKLPNITYVMVDIDTEFADNLPYKSQTAYEVTLKDKDPDSKYLKRLRSIPMCRFVRCFRNDNCNGWVFRLWTQL